MLSSVKFLKFKDEPSYSGCLQKARDCCIMRFLSFDEIQKALPRSGKMLWNFPLNTNI